MRVYEVSRQKVQENWTVTKTVFHNLVEFTDAACLGITSGFAIYQARTNTGLKHLWANVLLFAGLVIALQAFVLLVRHFNKPN